MVVLVQAQLIFNRILANLQYNYYVFVDFMCLNQAIHHRIRFIDRLSGYSILLDM